jgi:DNA repair protein RadC
MVMRYAIDTGAHTPSDNGHSGTAAPGLWSGGGNLGLSDADCFDCRHIPSSTTSSAVRGRQILERLFTVAKIDNASAVASALIAEFGSIGAVLYSDSRPAKSNMLDRICLSKADDVIEYLIVAMARLPIEEVRVLFLDSKNRLICDEVVSRGTISEAPIYPREILKRALAVDAAALILAHNHPSGDPDPSEGDIEATRRLLKAAKELGLTVHDHIIVGSEGWISLRDWVSFQ